MEYIPTDEYLDEVWKRRIKASSMPWRCGPEEEDGLIPITSGAYRIADVNTVDGKRDDGELIAHAPEDLYNLELGCRNLKNRISELEKILASRG